MTHPNHAKACKPVAHINIYNVQGLDVVCAIFGAHDAIGF
jgi:hypothetical protein